MRKGPAVLTLAVIVALLALSEHSRQQSADLPDLRGMTMDKAQLAAQRAGFNRLAGQDIHADHRIPLRASNWTVCAQQPPPAHYAVTTAVTVRVVKKGERCPG
ncbi:hypothetical protein [Streptomyces sp. NPDC046939]|uniref:hypothetical protein n=1 Tax=Streptomyces sp. NPDC046939 TaxID=3155376 RepID=UPI0033C87A0A